jgi:hypothetical protein
MVFYFYTSDYSRLVSDSYESPVFRKPFQAPFAVSLVDLNCPNIIFDSKLSDPHQ